MEDNILNCSPTVMFRGTPCSLTLGWKSSYSVKCLCVHCRISLFMSIDFLKSELEVKSRLPIPILWAYCIKLQMINFTYFQAMAEEMTHLTGEEIFFEFFVKMLEFLGLIVADLLLHQTRIFDAVLGRNDDYPPNMSYSSNKLLFLKNVLTEMF